MERATTSRAALGRPRPSTRHRRAADFAAGVVLLALVGTFLPGSFGSTGPLVTPELISGATNTTCSQHQGSGQTWHELKVEPGRNGTFSDGTLSVTITDYDGMQFDWTATRGVDAVLVKGGAAGHYLYRYDPPQEVSADANLTVPGNSISHISFCHDIDPPQARISIDPAQAANHVGDPHALTVTVERKPSAATSFSPAGSVDVSLEIVSGPGTLDAIACTTDASGRCSVTLDSSATGLTTVAASADVLVDGQTLSVSTDASGGNSGPARKRWVDERLSLTPAEAWNHIGDTHTFTAHLQWDLGDGGGFVDAGGETVAFSKTGVGTLAAASCATDASGRCTVDLDSETVGDTTVTASWKGDLVTAEGTVAGSASDEAVKHWVRAEARISIEPAAATNHVGDPHELTVTVERKPGTASAFEPAGGVAVSLSVESGPGSLDASSCTTDAQGTCSVVLHSSSTGLSVVSASADVAVDGRTLSVSTNAQDGNSGPARKRWVDARLLLTPPEAANRVGDTHLFTALLEFDEGAGFGPAPAGEVISMTRLSGPGTLAGASCETAADGTCSIALDSSETGLSTVQAAWEGVISTAEGSAGAGASDTAVKRWVDARLALDPPEATNIVGDPHTFTAHLEFDLGAGWIDAAGETVAFAKVSGPGSLSAASCSTDAQGRCSVVLDSSVTGDTVVEASFDGAVAAAEGTVDVLLSDQALKHWVEVDARIGIEPEEAANHVGDPHELTVTVERKPGASSVFEPAGGVRVSLAVDSGPGTLDPASCTTDTAGTCSVTLRSSVTGLSVVSAVADVPVDTKVLPVATDGQDGNSGPARKRWVDERLTLTPPQAANRVGDPHTFMAHLEWDLGDGSGFVDAHGETVTFERATGPGVLDASSCSTGGGGTCLVELTSAETGLTTVTASWQGDIVTAEGTVAGAADDAAVKRWVDARLLLTPEQAANRVGDTHTFTAHLRFDRGDGHGFVDAPDGETIAFVKAGGPGDLSADACATGADGRCSVDLDSAATGLTTVEASWEGVVATAEGSAPADASDDAVKRWVDARLSIDPPEATNFTGDTHPYTVHLEWDLGDGDGFVDAAGETVAVEIVSGPGSLSGATCTTGADGTCGVDLDSAVNGDTTVRASWDGEVATAEGTVAADASDEAVKHWVDVDAFIAIDPSRAANHVGDPHVFTITVEKQVNEVPSLAAGVPVAVSVVSGPGSLSAPSCTTEQDGTCRVTLSSTRTGLTVVAATADVDVEGKLVPVATNGEAGNSSPAVKRWVDERLTLTPPAATNLVGDTHTFTATLEVDRGDGFQAVADQLISFAKLSGPGELAAPACTTGDGGSCSVDLSSDVTGLTTVQASWSGEIASTEGVVESSEAATALKRWVSGALTVTPAGATNVVHDTHTFTAHLRFDHGDGRGLQDAAGELIAFTKLSGPGTLEPSCVTGAAGTCTVDLDSSEPGLTEIAATWTGDIATEEGAASTSFIGAATKTWVQPAIQIVKTASPDVGPPRDVTFTYDVTNVGDVLLTDVEVTDDVLGDIGAIDSLAPRETRTLAVTVAVDGATPPRNVGTACGNPTADGEVIGAAVCDDDDAVITVVLGSITRRLPRTGAGVWWYLFGSAATLWLGALLLVVQERLRRRLPVRP